MTTVLTAYVLMWPVLVFGILFTITRGFLRDMKAAKKEGASVI